MADAPPQCKQSTRARPASARVPWRLPAPLRLPLQVAGLAAPLVDADLLVAFGATAEARLPRLLDLGPTAHETHSCPIQPRRCGWVTRPSAGPSCRTFDAEEARAILVV